ncbi:MAG: alkylation response protein AidB-like acyl-CoA dehydrogenase [Candidatus Poriferisodalaceae bacterium]|jgi:alkylation response protein AidB-like acyl-CoA dehydrogenase
MDQQELEVTGLVDQLLADHNPKGDPVPFLGAQFDAGLAWIHHGEGDGGLAKSPRLQRMVRQKIADAGGPVLATHGTTEQKARWMRRLYTAEDYWCQLFSEPGAGSDPDQPKHEGLTYFIIDMEADGVEVRPLRQMTGRQSSTRSTSPTPGFRTRIASARSAMVGESR